MHPHRTRRLITLACILVLIATPSIWLWREHRQQTLNHALIAAIKRSDADAVDSLLAAGADPNTRDTRVKPEPLLDRLKKMMDPASKDPSPTALMVVLEQRTDNQEFPKATAQIVRRLLTGGADVNVRDVDGNTPLSETLVHPQYDNMLVSNPTENADLLLLLVSAGANIEFRGPRDEAPLMDACISNRIASLRILLDRGATPNTTSDNFGTPLSFVTQYGFTDIVALLKAHGAKQ